MLKQVISLQGPQWIRMKGTATRGGRAKQLRISTVLDVWVENESQRLKNEDPPPSKSLINSSKRLSRPEICKKQQDLQLFNKFPEQVWVLTSSYAYIKGFQNTYLDLAGELCSHMMRKHTTPTRPQLILIFCKKAWQKCWSIRAHHLQKRDFKTKTNDRVASRLGMVL